MPGNKIIFNKLMMGSVNRVVSKISLTCYLIKIVTSWKNIAVVGFSIKIFHKQSEITELFRWIEPHSVKLRKGRMALGLINQQKKLFFKPLVCT